MRSLRGTLTAGLLAAGSCLLLASLASSHWLAGGLLARQFDRGLRERATTLATLLEQVGERVELHFVDEIWPRYAAVERPEYFQLWLGERVLERSVSLVLASDAELPRVASALAEPTTWDLELPDGRAGRAIALAAPVHHYAPDPVSGADPGPAEVLVVVAIERADLDAAVRSLFLGVVALGAVLLVVLAVLATRVLALGLGPLERLTRELARVESEERPATALETIALPSELVPVMRRISSLTASLHAALDRERRTTANIAHELRTPVAELRTVTDVALQTPEDVEALGQAVAECRDIAAGLQAMITTLLALARSRAGNVMPERRSIQLESVVTELWRSFEPRARERALDWSLRVEPPIPTVSIAGEALHVVLSNVFDNACSHAGRGSKAGCLLQADGRMVRVVVTNSAANLGEADLARLAEPFWRADEARSEREHSGLGLALARECAAAAGIDLAFRLEDGCLLALVSIPRP